MLSSHIAAFLYTCVLLRLNITAVGETNTGKTTLINSLDLLAPSHYRKIYIEESPESLDQSFSSNHQLKYLVDPGYSNSSKIQEIYRLLHRNPDLVYLGEILTKEEAQAMFHCLSAGLRGFQTIHARDIDSLLNRWQYHFDIDPSCYNDLDILILLKRINSKRYVSEVIELTVSDESTTSHTIFQFDPETSKWSNMPDVDLLHCVKRKNLSKKKIRMINDQLAFYETVFDSLSSEQDWNVKQQVRYFHFLYNKIENLNENKRKINWNSLNLASEVN
jgi:energy-coupling factor transporter ATP-binding protein EcfA2